MEVSADSGFVLPSLSPPASTFIVQPRESRRIKAAGFLI